MSQMAHVAIQLIAAALLGAVIGIQRERSGKAAGLIERFFARDSGGLPPASALSGAAPFSS